LHGRTPAGRFIMSLVEKKEGLKKTRGGKRVEGTHKVKGQTGRLKASTLRRSGKGFV